jgi:hypothetical protein
MPQSQQLTYPPIPTSLQPVPSGSGMRIEAGRKTLGWEDLNVTRLAQVVGVSIAHLGNVLAGKSPTSTQLLEDVALALGRGWTAVLVMQRIEEAKRLRLGRREQRNGKRK